MPRFITTFLLLILSFNIALGQYSINDFQAIERKRFNKIRAHIRKIPKDKTNTAHSLANRIEDVANSDLEKAYAAFYWVSMNITYDMISFLAEITPPYKPKEVLKTRLAVCSGLLIYSKHYVMKLV